MSKLHAFLDSSLMPMNGQLYTQAASNLCFRIRNVAFEVILHKKLGEKNIETLGIKP
jgi:hypothetical protein